MFFCLFLLANLGESSMKKFRLPLFLALGIAMIASTALATPEQVPRQQAQALQAPTEAVVADGIIAAPTGQDQTLILVKQRHSPPVMIKMVLPASENVKRTLWLEAAIPSALPTPYGSHGLRMRSNVAFTTYTT